MFYQGNRALGFFIETLGPDQVVTISTVFIILKFSSILAAYSEYVGEISNFSIRILMRNHKLIVED